MRPVIGITCYVERASWGVWNEAAALVPLTYTRAVESAGGRPVVVPPIDGGADETLDALDGLVLAGGADIDPELYGVTRQSETTNIRPDRDRSEVALLEEAMARDMPVLAICRGMQLVNIVRGGDLVQHLPARDGHQSIHEQTPGTFARHDVAIVAGSTLCDILGPRAAVPSHHHQAPGRLGTNLEVVATAPDETTEAIEDRRMRMLLGVLWHPEETEDLALFEALVNEASIYHKERR